MNIRSWIFDKRVRLIRHIRLNWLHRTVVKDEYQVEMPNTTGQLIIENMGQLIKDHVEIYYAHTAHRVYDKPINSSFLDCIGLYGLVLKRDPELGVWYMNKVINTLEVVDTLYKYNAIRLDTMRTMRELYNWWTIERPNRPDAFDVAGMKQFSHRKDRIDNGAWEESLATFRRIQQEYTDRDVSMLQKFIDIRIRLIE